MNHVRFAVVFNATSNHLILRVSGDVKTSAEVKSRIKSSQLVHFKTESTTADLTLISVVMLPANCFLYRSLFIFVPFLNESVQLQ